jgi:S-adenosyl methyltransferase
MMSAMSERWTPGSRIRPGATTTGWAARTTTEFLTPELAAAWDENARTGRSDVCPRNRSEFSEFFAGLDLIDPGIVAVGEWRPDPAVVEHPAPVDASLFGAVARKP